ncbi:MAG: TolC family protein, partial [Hyphomonadaceae bacterium]
EESRARYLQVVGAAPGVLAPPPTPPPALPESLDEAVVQALSLNPALRQAREAERIASAQTDVERSALRPQLSAVARAERADDVGAPGVREDSASAVAQLSIPLFEGGYARSRVRQARINEARAGALTEESRRQAIQAVAGAWNEYRAAQHLEASSQAQLEASELAYRGVEAERAVGLRTTLDVLNAQQELLDARLAVANAGRDSYVAAHALLQAIGRLDADMLGVNVPLYDPAQHAHAVQRTLLSTEPADIPLRGREE